MQVEVEIDTSVYLPCYRHLVDSKYDIDLLYGGRDSGKSYFITQDLVRECITADYFRCILLRKTYESIKDSQFQQLKDVIEQWGLSSLFTYRESPLEIKCINGNKFIARGCDKPEKLKSISNASHAWYEEGNQLTEHDYITVSTTLRTNTGKVKEWFSFNPEFEGDIENYWLYKMYFANNPLNSSFKGVREFKLAKGKTVSIKYRATHTTYRDNPYCSDERIAKYESLASHDKYWYNVYSLGHWGSRRASGAEFYHRFNRGAHVKTIDFRPESPIHLSFDFNVVPYMTMLCAQYSKDNGKEVLRIFKEYCLSNPNNSVDACCSAFRRDFGHNKPFVFYYGDASGKNRIAGQGNKRNFDDVEAGLMPFLASLSDKVLTRNPDVFKRRDFINRLLSGFYKDIAIEIDPSCVELIKDLENVKTGIEGKAKESINDKDQGIRYQKYGHTSDALDYFICSILWDLYNATSSR